MLQWIEQGKKLVEQTVRSYSKRSWQQCVAVFFPNLSKDRIDQEFERWWASRNTTDEIMKVGEIMKSDLEKNEPQGQHEILLL